MLFPYENPLGYWCSEQNEHLYISMLTVYDINITLNIVFIKLSHVRKIGTSIKNNQISLEICNGILIF